MDMDQYKQEFLSDAREQMDSLNEDLLKLEKEGDNQEVVNRLFRAFHTLKGNSGMMGYKKLGELAHSLEDLLSRIRDKQTPVTRNVMDILFEGCDLLDQGIQAVQSGNPESIDPENVIAEIQGMKEKKAETVMEMPTRISLSPTEKALLSDALGRGLPARRVVIVMDPKNPLKNPKAMILARDLASLGTLVQLLPAQAEIVKGNFGTELSAVIATKLSNEELQKRFSVVYGVWKVFTLGLDEQYVKPSEVQHVEKEHAKERIAQEHQESVKQVQSVKVDMENLDKLMNLVGELLISNIRLQGISKTEQQLDVKGLRQVSEGIDRLILDLQNEVTKVRMVPIGSICRRFPRLVRDLAEKESKQVELEVQGAETEFDRTVLDQIGDPLVHLLRNSVDHGIESADARLAVGKAAEGKITLSVRKEQDHAVIQLSDDGAGIDPYKVRDSCLRKGILSETEASQMSVDELRNLIFRPGVSTNEQVTEVSGRGVGMDVVLSTVKALGGNLQLDSDIGKGTSVTIKLPFTVAILPVLLVRAGHSTYAVPLGAVDQIADVEKSRFKTMHGSTVFIHRDQTLPVFWLHELIGFEQPQDRNVATVIVLNRGGHRLGLIVDEILSQQQVLIKSLNELVRGIKGTSGATILADGNVVLVLDLDTLF